MRATESYKWLNKAPGTYDLSNQQQSGGNPFAASGGIPLDGGTYQIAIICTGTPSLTFQQLGPDGVTWENMFMAPDSAPGTPISALITSGIFAKVTVPPGLYRIAVATSTANYVSLTRVPTSE